VRVHPGCVSPLHDQQQAPWNSLMQKAMKAQYKWLIHSIQRSALQTVLPRASCKEMVFREQDRSSLIQNGNRMHVPVEVRAGSADMTEQYQNNRRDRMLTGDRVKVILGSRSLGDGVGVGVEPAEQHENDGQCRRQRQSHLLVLQAGKGHRIISP